MLGKFPASWAASLDCLPVSWSLHFTSLPSRLAEVAFSASVRWSACQSRQLRYWWWPPSRDFPDSCLSPWFLPSVAPCLALSSRSSGFYLAASIPVSARGTFPVTGFKRLSAETPPSWTPSLVFSRVWPWGTRAKTVSPRVHSSTHSWTSTTIPRSTCLKITILFFFSPLPVQPSCFIFSSLTFPRMPHTWQMLEGIFHLSYLLVSSSRTSLWLYLIEDHLKQGQDFPLWSQGCKKALSTLYLGRTLLIWDEYPDFRDLSGNSPVPCVWEPILNSLGSFKNDSSLTSHFILVGTSSPWE